MMTMTSKFLTGGKFAFFFGHPKAGKLSAWSSAFGPYARNTIVSSKIYHGTLSPMFWRRRCGLQFRSPNHYATTTTTTVIIIIIIIINHLIAT